MDIAGARALVTGGTSGIGLAIARALTNSGAQVLVVGQDAEKLAKIEAEIPHTSILRADLRSSGDRERLIRHVIDEEPPLDILVNNAGSMQHFELTATDAMERLNNEIQLNLTAPIHLATSLLPHLLSRPSAAIVNVTTSLVYAPLGITPGYSAAKCGLHGFTQALRWQTRKSGVTVIELLPPTVDTAMTASFEASKTTPASVAKALLAGLESSKTEIRPGQARALYAFSRLAPRLLSRTLNGFADRASRRD